MFRRKSDKPLNKSVAEEIEYVSDRLDKVRMLFDMETEDERIEAIIYEEKALSLRLDLLLRKAKEDKEITPLYPCPPPFSS